jgi:ribose 5-phosphate isomerase RpiB
MSIIAFPGPKKNSPVRVGIACDDGGRDLQQLLATFLRAGGFEVVDLGADSGGMDEALATRRVDRAVAVCSSALAASVCSARRGVGNDEINIICLGGGAVRRSVVSQTGAISLVPKGKTRGLGADRWNY